MKSSLVGAFICLAFLSACSKSAPQTPVQQQAADTLITKTPPTPYAPPHFEEPKGGFEQTLDEARIACQSAAACPTTVGLVIYRATVPAEKDKEKIDQYYQCTGTLIADDVVLTNSHCIPDEVKAKPSECSDRLGFVRARGEEGFPRYSKCASLIFASSILEGDVTQPDYALFRLGDKMTANPAPLSRKGFPDRSTLFTYSIDPKVDCAKPECAPKEIRGVLKKKTCTTVQNSLMATEFTHDFAKVITLFGPECEIIGGNSGSPIFAADGEIRGLAYGGRKTHQDKQIIAGQDRHIALGTNLACIKFGVGPELPDACLKSGPTNTGLFAFEPVRMSQAMQNEASKLVDQSPLFKFKIELEKMPFAPLNNAFYADLFRTGEKKIMQTLATLTPECLKPRSMWSQTQTRRKNGDEVLTSSVPSGLVVLSAKVDEYLRTSLVAGTEPLSPNTIRVVFSSSGDLKGAEIEESSGKKVTRAAIPLRWCTPGDLMQKFTLELQAKEQ